MRGLTRKLSSAAVVAAIAVAAVSGLSGCEKEGGIAAAVNSDKVYEQQVTDYVENFRANQELTDATTWAKYLQQNGYTPESLRNDVIEYYAKDLVIQQDADHAEAQRLFKRHKHGVGVDHLPDARLVRGDVMRLKGSEYIQSCILSGGKSWRIIMKHLLPNCVSTLIVTTTLGIPSAIMSEASLSFLGLGVQPPMSSWGQMINAAQPYIQSSTYYSVIPGIAIIITVMAFNLLGDALRDALDPKMRS